MATTKKTNQKNFEEEFKVHSTEVLSKVKELIKEGNARRIIIKNEKGKTLLEVPLTLGVVGVAFAPVFAAVGALAALVGKCSIVVERDKPVAPASETISTKKKVTKKK